jgi:two-component system, chemotaxis family, response regulator Rcp1
MSYRNATNVLEILLVEDSKSDAYLTQETLVDSKISHRLYIVKDGVEAIDFLYQRGKYTYVPRPDLILLDLNLPKKNGHEVLTEIKQDEILKSIPVVVVTTSTNEEDRTKACQHQVLSYWVKPVELDRLIDVMASIASID